MTSSRPHRIPRLASRPLLYYYSFLNLAKVLLLHSGKALPNVLRHGISDPKANTATTVSFSNQEVDVQGLAADNSLVFPMLFDLLTTTTGQAIAGKYKIEDLAEKFRLSIAPTPL